MNSVANFVRRTPGHILSEQLLRSGLAAPQNINWSARSTVGHINRLIDEADEVSRSRFLKNAERIAALADEPGQAALFQVCQNPEALEALENGHARAGWIFLHEPDAFRHAEEVRFTDDHRRGRKWDGFKGQPDLPVRNTPEFVDLFKAGIQERLGSQNVHVDIFDRQRPAFKEDKVYHIVQATIYREGRIDDFLEFVNGFLGWRPRRPVYEAAVTYESTSGVLEVVANDAESREHLVGLFAQHLLGTGTDQQKLPFRQYNLDILLNAFDFPTDPEDGIESVRVTQLRLMPLDTVGERVTLECSRSASNTIWEMAADHFGGNDPLQAGWLITKAKLAIRFHPEAGSRRSKTLPLTVTMPHGCDLKDRTDRERIVGEKCLGRWGMLKHV